MTALTTRSILLIEPAPRSLLWILLVLCSSGLFADQAFETETARPLPRGLFEASAAGEFQTSADGRELATPVAIEYGLFDGTEVLIEPVPFVSISPNGQRSESGIGDTEVTLTQLLLREHGGYPAFAIAGEVKLPTARRRLIGTGKADYSLYAVASKRLDELDLHANVGYTILGSPPGQHLHNIVDFALAGEFTVSARLDVFGELLANTSSGSSGDSTTSSNPEVAGAEESATLGLRLRFGRSADWFSAIVYDNNNATLIRSGVNYRF